MHAVCVLKRPDRRPLLHCPEMELMAETFRKVMGHFATGVTVVSALEGERP